MSGLCSAKEPSAARLSLGKIILTISVVFNFAKACKIKEGIKRKKRMISFNSTIDNGKHSVY